MVMNLSRSLSFTSCHNFETQFIECRRESTKYHKNRYRVKVLKRLDHSCCQRKKLTIPPRFQVGSQFRTWSNQTLSLIDRLPTTVFLLLFRLEMFFQDQFYAIRRERSLLSAKDGTTRWALVPWTMNHEIQIVTVAFIDNESHSNDEP